MKQFYNRSFIISVMQLIAFPLHAEHWVLNNPYPPEEANQKIYYSSFSEQPKTLDPARAYSSNEYQFMMQTYEPLLDFDYLARPYRLVPLLARSIPQIKYLDAQEQELPNADLQKVAYTVYSIEIKNPVFFQPHPAFAKDEQGNYRYLRLDENYLYNHQINQWTDFEYFGTRALTVDDYIYEIKRLADPAVNSAVYGLMSEHIVGFREFAKQLPLTKKGWIDLRQFSMAGLRRIDNTHFEIKIKGLFPQFMFWLSMPFFTPIPWEVDQFYSQPGMRDKNLSFDWYPIGTGPFMLSENNPNRRMVLKKNPNFRQDYFPTQGSLEDEQKGYLKHKAKLLPLIDQAIYILEKESIPRWNKFLQGYYDSSGISADSFDQAIHINRFGLPQLSPSMLDKKMKLTQTIDASLFYLGFNSLDPVIGGRSERARKLRLAISIAVNFDEYIAIFLNGRGKAAQGPLPPGIFGFEEGQAGINSYVYDWKGRAKRKSIQTARTLMQEAGYPNGIDPTTKEPLILNYDVPITGGPDDKARLDWMRKQFARLGIDLNLRATQYNRFQEKMRSGNTQIFSWGWSADYPDPENFLFLFYGSNGKVNYGGENAANYQNSVYDRLFEAMKNRPNDAERQRLIKEMVEILRHDAPWIWGVNSETLILNQQWVSAIKPNTFTQGNLKYLAIDVEQRKELRNLWNQPVLWPIGLLFLGILLSLIPLFFAYLKREKMRAPRVKL